MRAIDHPPFGPSRMEYSISVRAVLDIATLYVPAGDHCAMALIKHLMAIPGNGINICVKFRLGFGLIVFDAVVESHCRRHLKLH